MLSRDLLYRTYTVPVVMITPKSSPPNNAPKTALMLSLGDSIKVLM